MKEMCREMIEADVNFDNLQAESYLDEMKKLEKGGIRFMDVNKTDIKKTKRGPIIAATVCILFFVAMLGFIAIIVVLFGAMIVGTVIALKQRLKEIEGGEIYEARKY